MGSRSLSDEPRKGVVAILLCAVDMPIISVIKLGICRVAGKPASVGRATESQLRSYQSKALVVLLGP